MRHRNSSRIPSILFQTSRGALITAAPMLLAKALAELAAPFASGRLLDALVAGESIRAPLTILAALGAARLVLGPSAERILAGASREAELRIQRCVLAHVLRLGPDRTGRLGNGELVGALLRDAGAAGAALRSLGPQTLLALVALVGGGVAAFRRSWVLGTAFAASVPLAALLFRPYGTRFRRSAGLLRRGADGAVGRLFEFFHVLPFLQTLGAEGRFADGPLAALGRLRSGHRIGDGLAIGFGAAGQALSVAGECAVLGIGAALAAAGRISVGDVVAFQLLFLSAVGALRGLIALLPEAAALRESADVLHRLLDTPVETDAVMHSQTILAETNATKDFGEAASVDFGGKGTGDFGMALAGSRPAASPPAVECRDVAFSYPGSGKPVLRGLSLVVPGGAVAAVTGANGAGKTTLLKLLCGALRPDSGEILIGGVPLDSATLPAFRHRLGVVFQENLLLSHSLRDNVTLRDPAVAAAALDAALADSGAEAVVRRIPGGLRARVGNGGRSLSGGEIQKVAIARALARNSSLLVFDEVTNHLDAPSRAAFCELLESLRGRRTVLLVTHDPEVLRRCDLEISLAPPP